MFILELKKQKNYCKKKNYHSKRRKNQFLNFIIEKVFAT